jgi:hypothetical protein
MKKTIGYICIAIAVLNVIGFIYLMATNPDKLSNNSGYFVKKIIFSLGIGGLGIWLIQPQKNDNNNLQTKE